MQLSCVIFTVTSLPLLCQIIDSDSMLIKLFAKPQSELFIVDIFFPGVFVSSNTWDGGQYIHSFLF